MQPTTAEKMDDSPGNESSNAAAMPSLEQHLQAVSDERDALRERWLRSQADLENYRKRAQREADDERRYRVLPFVRDMLPALDNLQRAVDAAKSSNDLPQLSQGVQLVIKQFHDLLAKHSIQPIVAVGQPFDPNLHQALQQMPTNDHPPMTILAEYERGFVLHDRVVRPSTVIVAAPPPATSSTDSPQEP
ncbi:MAG: nucleotide exchange factor GrpE [Planctomycetales bacterium]|nr:nucleotide exchange factor GrpE [Planctomycetales bacterium]